MLKAKPQRSRATMLVVDCDRDLHRSLQKVMQEFQLSVTVSETTSQNLNRRALAPCPDVVLVNLVPPNSCLHLLSDLRQLWPKARVIFISASNDIHLYAEAIQLGAYDFLPRPLETSELGIILQRAVQTSHLKSLPTAVARTRS